MSSCLGLYIEENLIKYAKVSKDNDVIKVDAFGIKFVANKVSETIDKIVQETYSQRIPISINLSGENYNYFEVFSLLKKNDLQKAIKTEFETYCEEHDYNPSVFETRYATIEEQVDKDKLKVIYVSANKLEMNKWKQQVSGYTVSTISPVPMDLPNLIGAEPYNRSNFLVVNIEEKTTVTKILGNKIHEVYTIEDGSSEILSKINTNLNSLAKSYEICKESTIYTAQSKADLQVEESEYLQLIMPTLFNIVDKVKKIKNEESEKINTVFITGTGGMINNIDLYFQENLNVDCKILTPFFVTNIKEINLKDYQEVNSAISLALMGLGQGLQTMNFKKKNFIEDSQALIKSRFGETKQEKQKKENKVGGILTNDLGQKFTKLEKLLARVSAGFGILFIVYSIFVATLSVQIENKYNEAKNLSSNATKQISSINSDNEKIKSKTNEYSQLITELEALNNKVADKNKARNAIPNLLNQIMYVIPTGVQVTSIENTENKHISITAKSDKYEQLGYFKAKIKSDVILTNVVSTAGQKESNVVTVKIEGDLP